MAEILMPNEAGKFIVDRSKDVTIKPDGVSKVAKIMAECVKSGTYSIKSWKQHELNPKTMDKSAVDWIFLADTLNFSFWSADDSKKYMVRYGEKEHTGYWSLCAAMNRALDEGIPLTDASYFSTMSWEQMQHVFRSDSPYELPLLTERHAVMREAGNVLMQKYDGSFTNVISKCDKSAQTLMRTVVEDFQSFRDETVFDGRKVAIYKRVQILIADIWACFEGQGYGEFHDIDTITMFADYRIPQALLYFGALEYSSNLMEYLSRDHLMKSGDRWEVEIRGCSIWATELINEETRRILAADPSTRGLVVNAILIDHYLWDYRRDHADETKDLPFHRIRCIYY